MKKTCELPMIRKLGLGDNFRRKLLGVHKSYLGIGLIDPNTVIVKLAIKLGADSKRLQGKANVTIWAQEERDFVGSGMKKKEEIDAWAKSTGTKDGQKKLKIKLT